MKKSELSRFTRGDDRWMQRCRQLSAKAAEAGNTAVGSLIVLGGELVAEAAEAAPAGPDPFAHAELIAVRKAIRGGDKGRLADAVLYTTVEPCFLCSYAIRVAAIGRVVMGRPTPHTGGATSRFPILASPGIEGWSDPPILVWEPDRDEHSEPAITIDQSGNKS